MTQPQQQSSTDEALAEVTAQVNRVNELAAQLESSLHQLVEVANKADATYMALQGGEYYMPKHLLRAVGNICLPHAKAVTVPLWSILDPLS